MKPQPTDALRASLIALGGLCTVGCESAEPGDVPAAAHRRVTFTRDVAPIVFARCANCHRPGESAPFNLLTYEDVKRRARQIVAVTGDRYMPPWLPEPGLTPLAGDRRLSDEQIETLGQWVEQGTPEGDPLDLPERPRWSPGWQLGEPDLVIRMPEPFELSAEGEDVFRNLVIPIPVTGRRWVRAVELRPDNPGIVHHAEIRIDRTSSSRQRDAEDSELGFEGMDATGGARFPDGTLLGWTPGKQPSAGPAGTAWRLDEGSDMLLGLHLLPSGKPETLQATIGFFFAEQPPARQSLSIRLGSMSIDIPAGATDYTITDSYVLPLDVELLSIYPHAHYLGAEMKGWATLPDRSRKWLIHIREWDFNWQDQYTLVEPLALPAGTTLSMEYRYDNSTANARNPNNPPKRVVYGGLANDEMGDLWLQIIPKNRDDLPALRRDFFVKELRVRIDAAEKALLEHPDDLDAINDLAMLLARSGRFPEAISHLRKAVKIDPDFAGGYYNLGRAMALRKNFTEAIEHYRRALLAQPEYPEAHNSLGAAFAALGRIDDAVIHFNAALDMDPYFALAHFNLGAVHEAQGRPYEAVVSFGRAVAIDPDSADSQNRFANMLLANARADEAITAYLNVVRIDPDRIDAFANLGRVFVSRGRTVEAIEMLREANRLKTDAPGIKNDLAWILATHPDPQMRVPKEAITLAQEAARLTRRQDPHVLDTLSAAFASAGQFDLAMHTEYEAMNLAASAGLHDVAEKMRARVEQYRLRMPYQDASLATEPAPRRR